ncbi:MAG: hypothetical protein ACHWZW_18255 [Spirulina sp.]
MAPAMTTLTLDLRSVIRLSHEQFEQIAPTCDWNSPLTKHWC